MENQLLHGAWGTVGGMVLLGILTEKEAYHIFDKYVRSKVKEMESVFSTAPGSFEGAMNDSSSDVYEFIGKHFPLTKMEADRVLGGLM